MRAMAETGRAGRNAPADAGSRTPVAILVKRFPRLSETFILHEVLELRRQGLPVQLLAVMDPHEAVVHPEAEALVAEVTYLRNGDRWPELRGALLTARRHPRGLARAVGWALSRHSRAGWRRLVDGLLLVGALGDEPRHLHVHFANAPTTIAYVAHLITGQPYSVTMHAKDLYTSPAEHLRERCGSARALVTCTAANAAHYTSEVDPMAAVEVYPHGLVVERFTSVQRNPTPARILTVGRLVPKKGYLDLVQACALLMNKGVPFSWDIIGEGPQRSALESALEHSGLTEHVRLRGSLAQRDVIEAYASAEVFALAPVVLLDGDRDGIPNVVLEAMAAGLPVAATRAPGVLEVVEDETTGLLAAMGDPVSLAERLERLLLDPELRTRLGTAAKVYATQRCNLTTCVAPMTALLGKLQDQRLPATSRAHPRVVQPR